MAPDLQSGVGITPRDGSRMEIPPSDQGTVSKEARRLYKDSG
jgi:hypothetical protein